MKKKKQSKYPEKKKLDKENTCMHEREEREKEKGGKRRVLRKQRMNK